jgi:hypothetical protein
LGVPFSVASAHRGDFEAECEHFWTNSSHYYCILAGMGWYPDAPLPKLRYSTTSIEKPFKVFAALKKRTAELKQQLPSNYEYLSELDGLRREPALRR